MEDLTKHQLILLTLLVSFVTSVATGIITTSLLSQAPQTITQTINNVIEKTVQTVVPSDSKATVVGASSGGNKVQTEQEQLVNAIEKNQQSIVKVWGTYTLDPAAFISYGVMLNKEGLLVTDKSGVVEGGKYFAILPDGGTFPLKLIARNDTERIAYFSLVVDIQASSTDKKLVPQFTPAIATNLSTIKLGQTVAALTGLDTPMVHKGVITGIHRGSSLDTVSLISTDIPLNAPGFPALTLDGSILGIHTYKGGEGQIVPLANIFAGPIDKTE